MKKLNFNLALWAACICITAITGCNKINTDDYVLDFEHNYTALDKKQILGKRIFFDKNLSSPAGISCATCHTPVNGFSDQTHRAFSEGAIAGSFINRNAPSLGYLAYNPERYFDTDDSTYIGGFFWDGRVNSLEQQAIKPLMNHLEMNNGSYADLAAKLSKADYAWLFKECFGDNATVDSITTVNNALTAVAEFERSNQVGNFTSKYDYYLAGQVQLSAQEMRGLKLFNDTAKGKCANCHPSEANDDGYVLFTDFSYDNIGLPHNPNAPLASADYGLGGVLGNPAFNGQFKVPSLRNVAVSAPYFHNGYFNTLEEAVRFYSERDLPGKYPAPEVPENVNREELGNLHLNDDEINDIAAFLRTLTDGYKK